MEVFNKVKEVMDGFLDKMNEVLEELTTKAEAERAELSDLRDRMELTAASLDEFSELCSEIAAEVDDCGKYSERFHDLVVTSLDERVGNAISYPYANFAGFCSKCGREVPIDGVGATEGDKIICQFCVDEITNTAAPAPVEEITTPCADESN